MGRRGPESYLKRQKEIKRKQKAQDKLARRHGKGQQQAAEALGPTLLGKDHDATSDTGES